MPIPQESGTDDFGLLGWLVILIVALGFVAGALAHHLETHGAMF